MKNASSKKSPTTQTPGLGDAIARGEYGPDAKAVVALTQWARESGLAPTAVQCGAARIELVPQPPATTIQPPTNEDRKTLYKEFGGDRLAQMLEDDGLDPDDEFVPAVKS